MCVCACVCRFRFRFKCRFRFRFRSRFRFRFRCTFRFTSRSSFRFRFTVWKQLHTVLFKDIWLDEDGTEDGSPMVISAAYVADQVRKAGGGPFGTPPQNLPQT